MTFGLIGNIFGPVAEFLGYNRASEVFLPDFCPIVRTGERHGHMLHSSRANLKDVVHLLNTVIDFSLGTIEITTAIGERTIQVDEAITVIQQTLRKIKKNTSGDYVNNDSLNDKLFNALERIDKKT